jgi:hypothetical protein
VGVLAVPYFTQPSDNTCQSTCLKMMSAYYDRRLGQYAAARDIFAIWRAINQDPARPSPIRNHFENMVWWLNSEFPSLSFRYEQTNQPRIAQDRLVRAIDSGAPVLTSTNHSNTKGHIILIVGYEPFTTASGPHFVCHDPYGQFDPTLNSELWGDRRWEGGASLVGGGEHGPGRGVRYDIDGIRRIRADRHSAGVFYFLSAMTSV